MIDIEIVCFLFLLQWPPKKILHQKYLKEKIIMQTSFYEVLIMITQQLNYIIKFKKYQHLIIFRYFYYRIFSSKYFERILLPFNTQYYIYKYIILLLFIK